MSLFAIPFPVFDPVLVEVGPFAVRWYALAYIVGIVAGWGLAVSLLRKTAFWRTTSTLTPAHLDDFVVWATLGIILGGRLGYVLFYNLPHFISHPLQILQLWHGGMSFHGGFLGVVIATLLFCRRHHLNVFALGDLLAVVAPIGLFFGRIANFINGELYGRATDVAWGMIFPHGGDVVRHPSQLYQAGLEGLLLFVVMLLLVFYRRLLQTPGAAVALFFIGYGTARTVGEFFREPDAHIGFLPFGVTMGQVLSLPMIAIGIGLWMWAHQREKRP